MIGLIFTLSALLLLMLQIMVMDGILLWQAVSREIETLLGHDALIYPDHEPN